MWVREDLEKGRKGRKGIRCEGKGGGFDLEWAAVRRSAKLGVKCSLFASTVRGGRSAEARLSILDVRSLDFMRRFLSALLIYISINAAFIVIVLLMAGAEELLTINIAPLLVVYLAINGWGVFQLFIRDRKPSQSSKQSVDPQAGPPFS
jgi:hypothetical protein